jgi:Flp pilus assembly protein CpaB
VQQQASTTSDATPAQPDAAQPGLLTFEVTPTDALRLIAANSGGSRIYLTLLPSADGAATSPTSSTTSGASGSKTTASKAPANKAG